MALFGKKHVAGITEYELEHKKLRSHFDSILGSSSTGRTKRAALHTALEVALGRDANMPSSQKYGVIQQEEFDSIINGLHERGVISEDEAGRLRQVAEEHLNN